MKLLTLAEAGDRLGLSPSTLRVQVRNGRLAATKMGRDWVVTEKEVARYAVESRRPKYTTSISPETARMLRADAKAPRGYWRRHAASSSSDDKS